MSGSEAQLGYYTKKLRFCGVQFDAPASRHGQVAGQQPLHVKLMKDVKKGDRPDNIIWGEVRGFRFTTDNNLPREDVKVQCMAAIDGDVIFCPWTFEKGPETTLPIKHLVKKMPTQRAWNAHITQARTALAAGQPKDLFVLRHHNEASVLDPQARGGIDLESAVAGTRQGFDYIAVQVYKDKSVPMSSTELASYHLVLSAKHALTDAREIVRASGRDVIGEEKILWLKPFPMELPGEWRVSITLERRIADEASSSNGVGGAGPVCKPYEFTLTVNEAARAACMTALVEDHCRLGEELEVRLHATDCTGMPFQLPLPTQAEFGLTVSLEHAAASSTDGLVLVGADTAQWERGEAEDGSRPLMLKGVRVQGKLGKNGKRLRLRFEASGNQAPPSGAACKASADVHVHPGAPAQLTLTYDGKAEPHGASTDPASLHIQGEQLKPSQRLKEMQLRVMDIDGNLTQADVFVGGSEALQTSNGDILGGEEPEHIVGEDQPAKVITLKPNSYSVRDREGLPGDLDTDDIVLTFSAAVCDAPDLKPTASVHFRMPDAMLTDDEWDDGDRSVATTEGDEVGPPQKMELLLQHEGHQIDEVRVGMPFEIKLRALDAAGREVSLPPEVDQSSLLWEPNVLRSEDLSWECISDLDGEDTLRKSARLRCIESEVTISVRLPASLSLLEQESQTLHVLRGPATSIGIEGGDITRHTSNGCELDEPLSVCLLDESGAITDQKPAAGGGVLKWSVHTSETSACVVDFKEIRQVSARLQGRVLTAAAIQPDEVRSVSLTLRYGSIDKAISLYVRAGPVPRRLLIDKVDISDSIGELVEDESERMLLRGIAASDTDRLPELAVRVELENLATLSGGQLKVQLNQETEMSMRASTTIQLPSGELAEARLIDAAFSVPATLRQDDGSSHKLQVTVDATNAFDRNNKAIVDLLGKAVPPNAESTGMRSRLFLMTTIELQLLPASPSVLALCDGPSTFTSEEGWSSFPSNALVPALLLRDDFGNPITDTAPALAIGITLYAPAAPLESAASSSMAASTPTRPAAIIAHSTDLEMRSGELRWPNLQPALDLTAGGRTGTYTLHFEGRLVAEGAHSPSPVAAGDFEFQYHDPSQLAEDVRERSDIANQLPQLQKKGEALKRELGDKEKVFQGQKRELTARHEALDRARQGRDAAEHDVREKQQRCESEAVAQLFDVSKEKQITAWAQELFALVNSGEPTVTLTLDEEEGATAYRRQDLDGRRLDDGRMLVVRPETPPSGADSCDRRLGVYMQGADGAQERRDCGLFELPSAEDELLKQATHQRATLCHAASVTDRRIGELVLALLGGDVALLGIDHSAQTALPTALARLRELTAGAALIHDGVSAAGVKIDPSGLLEIDGDVLPPQPSSTGAGEAAYLCNLMYVEPHEEKIREALFTRLGRTVVLMSEDATSARLVEYYLGNRARGIKSVVLLGRRADTGPFEGVFDGISKMLPRLTSEPSALRCLPLELPTDAFDENGTATDEDLDEMLQQVLAATPTGTTALGLLHARTKLHSAVRKCGEEEAKLPDLEASCAVAKEARDAVKQEKENMERELERLKKRKRELELTCEDEEEDYDQTTAPTNSSSGATRRTSQRIR